MNANYVLKFDEAVLVPQDKLSGLSFVKKGVWIIVFIATLGSIIFQDNLFGEMSWTTIVLLIVIAVVVSFIGGKKIDVPSPVEIQFYDDHLVIYRPKRYYSKKVTRMEHNKMMYAEIRRCVYKAQSKRLHIYGNVHAVWHNVSKDGVVSQLPTYDRVVNDTLQYFSTRCAENVNFKNEIEQHSPIMVSVENS